MTASSCLSLVLEPGRNARVFHPHAAVTARFGILSFQPEMTDLQRQVLDLLDIPTSADTASWTLPVGSQNRSEQCGTRDGNRRSPRLSLASSLRLDPSDTNEARQ